VRLNYFIDHESVVLETDFVWLLFKYLTSHYFSWQPLQKSKTNKSNKYCPGS